MVKATTTQTENIKPHMDLRRLPARCYPILRPTTNTVNVPVPSGINTTAESIGRRLVRQSKTPPRHGKKSRPKQCMCPACSKVPGTHTAPRDLYRGHQIQSATTAARARVQVCAWKPTLQRAGRVHKSCPHLGPTQLLDLHDL